MGKRRDARVFSFQFLYSCTFVTLSTNLEDDLKNFSKSTPPPADDQLYQFALDLIKGTVKHAEEIENIISTESKNWRMERFSKVDLVLLKQAIYEMIFFKKTPPHVVINEAIEMAKEFSAVESASFINGILDRVKTVYA